MSIPKLLRKELPQGRSEEVLKTRVGPGPSGEVLMTRVGPNCADNFFAHRDVDNPDDTLPQFRFIHDFPLSEDPQTLDES